MTPIELKKLTVESLQKNWEEESPKLIEETLKNAELAAKNGRLSCKIVYNKELWYGNVDKYMAYLQSKGFKTDFVQIIKDYGWCHQNISWDVKVTLSTKIKRAYKAFTSNEL